MHQPICFAVATWQKVEDALIRQVLHGNLLRRRDHLIGFASVPHDSGVAKRGSTDWKKKTATFVAKAVVIWPDRHRRTRRDLIWCQKVGLPRRVDVQQDHHRRWLRCVEGDLEADLDLHAILSTLPSSEA